ncbi:MAG: MaoC family dehydratase [Rhodospirillales bacterium]
MAGKTNHGNFFEDFRLGQRMVHAAPRTVTTGDTALYTALYGGRFPLHGSDETARAMGFARAPVDDLLVFHIVFGKSVADVSLNAVANLGYAETVFPAPVYPGDTLSAVSEVIGLKQNSNGRTGVVYVRTSGVNQHGTEVLRFVRWVMVNKRDEAAPAPEPHAPELSAAVPLAALAVPAGLRLDAWDGAASGAAFRFGDYAPGERMDHVDGVTVEEAEHMLAARLYQNTARVHFNQHVEGEGRFGRRIVYGGHVISLARALSFNGLGAAFKIAAVNGGRHTAPLFAGDTVYAWSEVLAAHDLPGRDDLGALRLRTVACKNRSAADFPGGAPKDEGADESVILDLDYTVFMPK